MAEKSQAGAPTKTVMKPGVICGFLDTFAQTADRESFQLSSVRCNGQEVDNLLKSCEEIKEVTYIDLSNNSLADISSMKDLSRLTKLTLTNNKIKNMNIFAMEECFPNLK